MFKRLNGLIKEKKIGVIIIIAFLLVISIFIAYELIFNLSGLDAIFGTLGLGIIFFMIISLLYGVSLKSDDEIIEVKYDNIYIYIKYEEYDIKLLREQFYINNFKKDINGKKIPYIKQNLIMSYLYTNYPKLLHRDPETRKEVNLTEFKQFGRKLSLDEKRKFAWKYINDEIYAIDGYVFDKHVYFSGDSTPNYYIFFATDELFLDKEILVNKKQYKNEIGTKATLYISENEKMKVVKF